MRPFQNEYPAYYETYIKAVQEDEPIQALAKSYDEIQEIAPLLTEKNADFRYAEGKWSVKELLQHTIDTERIMAYRALTIARADRIELPGFDENTYAQTATVANRRNVDLLEELQLVRKSSIHLFKSFDQEALLRAGIANKNTMSVRALAFIIAGHQKHHFNVLKERYLQ